MADRVVRYREKTPLMESSGVDAEIRSTLSRRVDLPSGGYLVFDYAEAFTVIDVNTGRFVGGRGKSSGGRLEDTITKNNLEAVKEVVRQLRLRDIGGIIVIDFIDMANPKNRATVEEALKTELERDRTKTYVVEISPLGLVEMTRQNVTDGPREILTRKCTVCGGDGVVLSEASAAVDVERHLRALAAGAPRTKAFKVELNARVASMLVGPGASRLTTIEEETKRRFLLVFREDVAVDHFEVLGKGSSRARRPTAPGRGGRRGRAEARRGRPPRRQRRRRQARRRLTSCVGSAASWSARGRRCASSACSTASPTRRSSGGKKAPEPITAESAAEKPTRKPPAKKQAEPAPEPEAEAEAEAEAPEETGEAEPAVAEEETPRRSAAEEEDQARFAWRAAAQEEAGHGERRGQRRRCSRAAERRQRRGPEDPPARSHARPRGRGARRRRRPPRTARARASSRSRRRRPAAAPAAAAGAASRPPRRPATRQPTPPRTRP